MRKKSAFALAEVLVSALIVAISFAGVISAFMAARTYSIRAQRRLAAVNLAREGFTMLNQHVRADTWDSDGLSVPISTFGLTSISLPGTGYGITYTCSNVATKGYRRVIIRVTYPS